jgi:hypothetical protein
MKTADQGNPRRRNRALLGVGLSLLVAPVALGVPGPASAEEARSQVLVASAQAIRVTYTVPDYVAVADLLDGGGPVSQVVGDTGGRSVAFASLPYPGETAVFGPGTLAAATGQPAPAAYPFYARADHPIVPKSEVKDPSGTYLLEAVADQGKGSGLAAVQLAGAGEDAVSHAVANTRFNIGEGGRTTVLAETTSRGLSFGKGTLTIASVTSRAVTTYVEGEDKPVTKTEMVVEGAKVGDQSVTIGPDGVHSADKAVPVPVGESTKNLNEALKQAGIAVRSVSAQPTEGGASSDVLEVTNRHPLPVEGNPQGTVTWRFGGATTSVALGGPSLTPVDTGAPYESVAPESGEQATEPASLPTGSEPLGYGAPSSAAGSDYSAGAAQPSYLNEPSATDEGAMQAGSPTSAPTGALTQSAAAPMAWELGGRMRLVYAALGLACALLVLVPVGWRFHQVRG